VDLRKRVKPVVPFHWRVCVREGGGHLGTHTILRLWGWEVAKFVRMSSLCLPKVGRHSSREDTILPIYMKACIVSAFRCIVSSCKSWQARCVFCFSHTLGANGRGKISRS